MTLSPANIVGIGLLACGYMMWAYGSSIVRGKWKRRVGGKEQLMFDGEPKVFRYGKLNGAVRSELFFYGVLAVVLLNGGLFMLT
ncbi:MAG: hypothetical protein JO171_20005 [Paludibacterium sp.]|uniref:hypothetical protein n=1 Tax=Paludibacterium sp. TaxID=1917523 RepID=UPI0025CFC8A6|nr:hypothetical protein [Paludibacterium sp.]MBV8049438.1 hypothetical protein [Paludibacterium sp.]